MTASRHPSLKPAMRLLPTRNEDELFHVFEDDNESRKMEEFRDERGEMEAK